LKSYSASPKIGSQYHHVVRRVLIGMRCNDLPACEVCQSPTSSHRCCPQQRPEADADLTTLDPRSLGLVRWRTVTMNDWVALATAETIAVLLWAGVEIETWTILRRVCVY
jgi:hypothetical protein